MWCVLWFYIRLTDLKWLIKAKSIKLSTINRRIYWPFVWATLWKTLVQWPLTSAGETKSSWRCCRTVRSESAIPNASWIFVCNSCFPSANGGSAAQHCYRSTVNGRQSEDITHRVRVWTWVIKQRHAKVSHVSPWSLHLSKALLTTNVLSVSRSPVFCCRCRDETKTNNEIVQKEKKNGRVITDRTTSCSPNSKWLCLFIKFCPSRIMGLLYSLC